MAMKNVHQVLVVGDLECGKTSLIKRFKEDSFDETYAPTRLFNWVPFSTTVDEESIRVAFMDTSGKGDFEHTTGNHWRAKDIFLIVCDISKMESLESLAEFLKDINDLSGQKEPLVVISGNKSDLAVMINEKDIEDFASDVNVLYFETSAKTGKNVKEMFTTVLRKSIKTKNFSKNMETGNKPRTDNRISPTTDSNGCSCVLS